jgi:ABC-type arginine/histidine transport system permease subunit
VPTVRADGIVHDLEHLLWPIALLGGFFAATAVALGKASTNRAVSKLADWFILLFRG